MIASLPVQKLIS